MRNISKEQLAKGFVVWVFVIPLCLVWDTFYKGMQYLMKLWDVVDKRGDQIVEKIYMWSEGNDTTRR